MYVPCAVVAGALRTSNGFQCMVSCSVYGKCRYYLVLILVRPGLAENGYKVDLLLQYGVLRSVLILSGSAIYASFDDMLKSG